MSGGARLLMRGNTYTFVFMTVICIACALLVAGTATLLKPMQQYAEKIDTYKNVLRAAGLIERGKSVAPAEVEKIYAESIKGVLIDREGNVKADSTNLTPEDVYKQSKVLKGTPGYVPIEERTYPLYTSVKNEKLEAYIVPVYGQGLWSTLYGYLSLEPDGKTIRSLVFYKEGETPGLGKEITKDWFQDQFKGKTYIEDEKIAFTVGKPKEDTSSDPTKVAGISGATITGRGVEHLVKDMMQLYRPYFEKNVWGK